jgi:CHU_C Type IX secretion signal domain
MTRKNLLLAMVILIPAVGWGQIVISDNGSVPTYFISGNDPTKITTIAVAGDISIRSANVDLGTVALILKSSSAAKLSTASALSVDQLTIDGAGDYTLSGPWTITTGLTLTKGNLIIDRTTRTSKLVYTGSSDVSGGSASSFINGPLFIRSSANTLTFPIGDDKGYAPVRLDDIDNSSDKNVELGFDITTSVSGFAPSGPIKEISNARYWQFSVTGGTFPGSSISIGYDAQTESFQDSPSVLELPETTKIQKDLGGKVNNGFFSSTLKTSGLNGAYALAKSDVVRIAVHKLITPDDDGKNDVLYIDGIDAYPENRVTILDRWGVPFKKWDKPFVNYTLPANSSQPLDGIDYRSLAVGNYIVIVEYTELGRKKNIQQMISVLK